MNRVIQRNALQGSGRALGFFFQAGKDGVRCSPNPLGKGGQLAFAHRIL
jgi:hypothetical protein